MNRNTKTKVYYPSKMVKRGTEKGNARKRQRK